MKIVAPRRALAAIAGVVGVSGLEWPRCGRLRSSPCDIFSGSLPSLGPNAIAHVGHSTHLVSVAGVRMLTDPWFYDPAFRAPEPMPGETFVL